MTWYDADMFFLIASAEMSSDDLIDVARSLYNPVSSTQGKTRR